MPQIPHLVSPENRYRGSGRERCSSTTRALDVWLAVEEEESDGRDPQAELSLFAWKLEDRTVSLAVTPLDDGGGRIEAGGWSYSKLRERLGRLAVRLRAQ